MADLGFVGLGVMGGNTVARLLEKGHTVTGYNRTRTKAQWLIDKGMKWADMPRSMCRSGRYVLHGDQYRGAASHRGRSGWHARRAGGFACSGSVNAVEFFLNGPQHVQVLLASVRVEGGHYAAVPKIFHADDGFANAKISSLPLPLSQTFHAADNEVGAKAAPVVTYS